MQNQTLIGRGRTAEIYTWTESRVLKLFFADHSKEEAQLELQNARIVHNTVLRTPAVDDVIEIEGRYGIVYEKLRGVTMAAQMQAQPLSILQQARRMAELHALMHGQQVTGLVDQNARLITKIKESGASTQVQESALRALAQLAGSQDSSAPYHICHGDFHPENIIITPTEAVVIDWIDASQGHPLADVARSWLLLHLFELPTGFMHVVMGAVIGLFRRTYLQHYFKLSGGDPSELRKQLKRWLFPVAVARLSEGISQERQKIFALIKSLDTQN